MQKTLGVACMLMMDYVLVSFSLDYKWIYVDKYNTMSNSVLLQVQSNCVLRWAILVLKLILTLWMVDLLLKSSKKPNYSDLNGMCKPPPLKTLKSQTISPTLPRLFSGPRGKDTDVIIDMYDDKWRQMHESIVKCESLLNKHI